MLRQVDANELLTIQTAELPAKAKKPSKVKMLEGAALADVFGIEMANVDIPATKTPKKKRTPPSSKTVTTTSSKRAKNATIKTIPRSAAKKVVAAKKTTASKSTVQRNKKS